jgi:hypothetical protein
VAKTDKQIKAILIEDASLLQQVEAVRDGRRDGTVTKTARDLIRERLTEIRVAGDPARVTETATSAVA